jgi:hypothetical protein
MSASKTPEQQLEAIGVSKALKGYPALFGLVILLTAALEIIASVAGFEMKEANTHILIAGGATLLGLIGYFWGDFWDSYLFDPRYSYSKNIAGKWLKYEDRPYHLFPAGAPLARARAEAIDFLTSQKIETKDLYKNAKGVAINHGLWNEIEHPLILSKFIRSFLWPLLAASVTSLTLAVVSFIKGWPQSEAWWPQGLSWFILLGFAALLFFLFLSLFIPYFRLRVDHMISLYGALRETHK